MKPWLRSTYGSYEPVAEIYLSGIDIRAVTNIACERRRNLSTSLDSFPFPTPAADATLTIYQFGLFLRRLEKFPGDCGPRGYPGRAGVSRHLHMTPRLPASLNRPMCCAAFARGPLPAAPPVCPPYPDRVERAGEKGDGGLSV